MKRRTGRDGVQRGGAMRMAPGTQVWQPVLLALLLVGAAARGRADDSLTAFWGLDEGTGTTAADAVQGRQAVVHGARWVAGWGGGALWFDGKDDWLELGDLGSFRAVTIAFWMKPEAAYRPEWQGLVSSDAWERGVFHVPLREGAVDVNLHLKGSRRGRLQSPPLQNGVWQHVALTADRAAGIMRLYVNGVGVDVWDLSRTGGDIKLVRQVAGREDEGRWFSGTLDEIRFYSRALTETEIRHLCPTAPPPSFDRRNIRLGFQIPDEGYCDQPYVVVNHDGSWLCVLTTGKGWEGDPGEHVVATRSGDHGRTWTTPVPLEPATGPESAYATLIGTPFGRVYVFYGYNGDNIRELKTWKGKFRGDMMGWCVTRYSDDGGCTWSPRFRLPMRITACDRGNDWNGKVQIWWSIDKPVTFNNEVYWAFTKLGRYMISQGEGWLYHSDNLLTERDLRKVHWELLPAGDHGIRAPEFGSTQEEHNVVALSDGSLYCVYRTTQGHPCHSYSRDGGRTWTKPEFMTYTPGGRPLETPRACPKVWSVGHGRYLFWFHNHNGKSFKGRNPAWISGGVERDGYLYWSQPEILLYDPDPNMRMSYPDLIQDGGRFWVTETQKSLARVHEIDPTLLAGLWRQGEDRHVTRQGLLVDADENQLQGGPVGIPRKLDLRSSTGVSIGMWLRLDAAAPATNLVDSRAADGRGLALDLTSGRTLRATFADGRNRVQWDCDPDLLSPGADHHVMVILDAQAQVLMFVVDGRLCDGGEKREYGWLRLPHRLTDLTGSGQLRLPPAPDVRLRHLRVYERGLRVSEAVANFHAGLADDGHRLRP